MFRKKKSKKNKKKNHIETTDQPPTRKLPSPPQKIKKSKKISKKQQIFKKKPTRESPKIDDEQISENIEKQIIDDIIDVSKSVFSGVDKTHIITKNEEPKKQKQVSSVVKAHQHVDTIKNKVESIQRNDKKIGKSISKRRQELMKRFESNSPKESVQKKSSKPNNSVRKNVKPSKIQVAKNQNIIKKKSIDTTVKPNLLMFERSNDIQKKNLIEVKRVPQVGVKPTSTSMKNIVKSENKIEVKPVNISKPENIRSVKNVTIKKEKEHVKVVQRNIIKKVEKKNDIKVKKPSRVKIRRKAPVKPTNTKKEKLQIKEVLVKSFVQTTTNSHTNTIENKNLELELKQGRQSTKLPQIFNVPKISKNKKMNENIRSQNEKIHQENEKTKSGKDVVVNLNQDTASKKNEGREVYKRKKEKKRTMKKKTRPSLKNRGFLKRGFVIKDKSKGSSPETKLPVIFYQSGTQNTLENEKENDEENICIESKSNDVVNEGQSFILKSYVRSSDTARKLRGKIFGFTSNKEIPVSERDNEIGVVQVENIHEELDKVEEKENKDLFLSEEDKKEYFGCEKKLILKESEQDRDSIEFMKLKFQTNYHRMMNKRKKSQVDIKEVEEIKTVLKNEGKDSNEDDEELKKKVKHRKSASFHKFKRKGSLSKRMIDEELDNDDGGRIEKFSLEFDKEYKKKFDDEIIDDEEVLEDEENEEKSYSIEDDVDDEVVNDFTIMKDFDTLKKESLKKRLVVFLLLIHYQRWKRVKDKMREIEDTENTKKMSKKLIPDEIIESVQKIQDRKTVVKEGWLIKEGKFKRGWKKRYFRLFKANMLKYYENEKTDKIKGEIRLLNLTVRKVAYKRPHCLSVKTSLSKRVHFLCCTNEYERSEWVDTLREYCISLSSNVYEFAISSESENEGNEGNESKNEGKENINKDKEEDENTNINEVNESESDNDDDDETISADKEEFKIHNRLARMSLNKKMLIPKRIKQRKRASKIKMLGMLRNIFKKK